MLLMFSPTQILSKKTILQALWVLFTQYNSNELTIQHEKSCVELKHGFSNCESSWKLMLYRYAIDFICNKIQFTQGNQLNDDPYISILPSVSLENKIELYVMLNSSLFILIKNLHLTNIPYQLMTKIFGFTFTYFLKNNLLII